MNVVPQPPSAIERGTEHDADLFLWSREQARLLEEKRFEELDLPNLIDEVRAWGASEKREIRDRLDVLLMHLLKWRYQPARRSGSWRATLRTQREQLRRVLDDNPSLRGYPARVLDGAYDSARLKAEIETGLDFSAFPKTPPFTVEQALDPDFLPHHPDDAPNEDTP